MSIQLKCPKCGHKWPYKGSGVLATCPSCYGKVRVRSLPDADPQPRAPAAVKKILAKKSLDQPEPVGPALSQAIERSQTPDVELVRGEVLEKPAGRKIQTETIVTPSPVPNARIRPLQAKEVTGASCKYCRKPLRDNPLLNVMLDGQTKLHASCLLTKIIMECNGDLQAASLDYGVPLQTLQQRVLKLKELGLKMPVGVLN